MRELLSKPQPKKIEWFILGLISMATLMIPTYYWIHNTRLIIDVLGEFGFGLSFIVMQSAIMFIIIIVFKVPTKQKDGSWK